MAELVAAFIVGLLVGTWVSRRKAVARAYAKGVESVTASASATGGSVVFVGSADEYRSLAVGAAVAERATDLDAIDHPATATYSRRAVRLARGRVGVSAARSGGAVGAGRPGDDSGPVRAVNGWPDPVPIELSAVLREPWRFDEADPRFDPYEGDTTDQDDES